jgi:putative ABC transport system substrate-binding protein
MVVVNSSDSRMYQDATAALRALPGIAIEAKTLPTDASAVTAALAHAGRDTAVVAFGNRASDLVAGSKLLVPAVHCMVTGDAESQVGRLRVPLGASASVHATWLRRLLPAARTVAILYTPAFNARSAAQMGAELESLGYGVITEPVETAALLPQALRRIGKADALLAMPDPAIYSPELARGLLLFTYRTRTPLLAYSQAWVRAGALYAIDWKSADLGTYCGSLALALLTPTPNAIVPPAMPAPRVTVNLRVAAQLGLEWTAADLAGVETIRE